MQLCSSPPESWQNPLSWQAAERTWLLRTLYSPQIEYLVSGSPISRIFRLWKYNSSHWYYPIHIYHLVLAMSLYRTQLNLEELGPSTVGWTIEDWEQADTRNFSPRLYALSPSQILLDRLADPHYGSNFNPAQVSPFTQGHDFMSWHYQVDWTPYPAQQSQGPQSGHEIYREPVSPAEEGSSHYRRHTMLTPLSQDSSIMLSSPAPHNPFLYPDSPQLPFEQEKENIERLMSPFSPILEDFLDSDSDNDEESDHQEPDPDSSDERSLATLPYASDDIDCDQTAPYAVLIYRALMSAPRHRMVLAEIYQYFREKISRFKKAKGRGWMNSIRHNLSMNGVSIPSHTI